MGEDVHFPILDLNVFYGLNELQALAQIPDSPLDNVGLQTRTLPDVRCPYT